MEPERIKDWLDMEVTREMFKMADDFWLDALKRVMITDNVERQIGVVQGIGNAIDFLKRGGE
jgi:hypothetical protein